jgi:Skp family chaperone for outer membrane proteins
MKKIFYILLSIIIISIAVIIFLKISNFHFAKIGYVMHSKNIENSKEKKVFIEELKPSRNQISNHQTTIEEVFAENPWFYRLF